MKKINGDKMLFKNLKFLAIFISLLFVVSCSDDSSEPTIDESLVLAEYIESSTDFINSSFHPGTFAATDLKPLLAVPGAVYLIDIRSASDYNNGHINGAINIEPAMIIEHVEGMSNTMQYQKIVIMCNSGQTAIFCSTLMRLLGYDNVVALAFGMSSWHEYFAANYWSAKISNKYASVMQKTASPAKPAAGNMPEINTGKKDGLEILKIRTKEVLAEGFGKASVTADEVITNPDKYFVVSYWPENHYLEAGHIPGSIQYTPKQAIKLATDLKTLPTDKTIVVYCYTGSGSAAISAYLKCLGYDAKSLVYGMNGSMYDVLKEKGYTYFSDATIKNYEYVK